MRGENLSDGAKLYQHFNFSAGLWVRQIGHPGERPLPAWEQGVEKTETELRDRLRDADGFVSALEQRGEREEQAQLLDKLRDNQSRLREALEGLARVREILNGIHTDIKIRNPRMDQIIAGRHKILRAEARARRVEVLRW